MGVYVNVRGVGEGVGVIISQGHSSFPNEATFMKFHPRLSYLALHATYQQLKILLQKGIYYPIAFPTLSFRPTICY